MSSPTLLSDVIDKGRHLQVYHPDDKCQQRLVISVDIIEESRNKKPRDLCGRDFEVSKPRWEKSDDCVLFRKYPSYNFCVVTFSKRCTKVIKHLLERGVDVKFCSEPVDDKSRNNGDKAEDVVEFRFFGYSHNHLKDRKCVLYNRKLDKHSDILSSFGKFENIAGVSKRAARIGLLFSTAQPVVWINKSDIGVISDIVVGKYNYTDGCGLISVETASKIVQHLQLEHRYQQQTPSVPSVFQIRFQGCKGVLMVDPNIKQAITLRKSMMKFEWNGLGADPLCLVSGPGISRPYKVACLNTQFVRLLSTLGVSDDVFLSKTYSYLAEVKHLDELPGDMVIQVKHLCAEGYFLEAESLIEGKERDERVKKALKLIKKKKVPTATLR